MKAKDIVLHPISGYSYEVTITNRIIPGMEKILGIEEKEKLMERFNRGDTCFLAKDNGKYLGILWGHTGDCYVRGAGKRLCLMQNETYLYGVFTLPEARHRSIFNTLKNAFLKYYSSKGISSYYALVSPQNKIMRASLRKNGFTEKSLLLYIRFFHIGLLYEFKFDYNRHRITLVKKEPHDCYII